MKFVFGLIAGLMSLQQIALADHASLERLSREMTSAASSLYIGARQVIGPRPTYRQRYAYEHVSFFHNSAHQFERVLGDRSDLEDDHSSNIHYAFRRLERDLYYARQTFYDLSYGDFTPEPTDDHPSLGNLERYLRYAETLIYQIRNNLP